MEELGTPPVSPLINDAKVCRNCGNINHKSCTLISRCIYCGQTSHTSDLCTLLPQCLNCKKNGTIDIQHRCDTEACPLLAEKTRLQNEFIINLLLGEDIIKDWKDILSDEKIDRITNQSIQHSTKEIEINQIIIKK
jgi:hypothetical protein